MTRRSVNSSLVNPAPCSPVIRTSASSISFNLNLTSIAALPEFLYNARNFDFDLQRVVNTNVIILTSKCAWGAYQQKKDMTPQQYRTDIVRRIAMYLTNEIKSLPCHRDNTYKHGGITIPGARRRNFDQRQKMIPSDPR